MANPHKGDVTLSVGDRAYTMCYSHLALVKLENLLDKDVMQIMGDLQQSRENIRVGTVVALLWAGLQKHHPEISYEDAAGLLDDIDGGVGTAMETIGRSFEKAFSAPGTKGTNPQMNGMAGTGMHSTSSTPATILPSQTHSGT